MVSSLEDHPGWKGDEPPQTMEETGLTDVQPPRSKTPRRGRDTSTERGLAKVREAHWRALATTAALEEEIEQLSWSVTRANQRPMPTPEAGIATDGNLGDGTGGTTWCVWRRAMPLTSNITLPGGVQHLKKMKRLSWISTWKLCQSWDQRSSASSRGQLNAWGGG